jgi:MFS family permease
MPSWLPFATHKPWLNTALFYFATFLLNFGIFVFPPLLVDIQRSLNLSLPEISLVPVALGIGRLLGNTPAGIWVDRAGHYSVYTISIFLTLLGTAAAGSASSIWMLLVACLLFGLGHAFRVVGGLSILMEKYRYSRWGSVINLYEFTGISCTMLSVMIAGKLALHFGWRNAFFWAFGMAVLSMAVVQFGICWKAKWQDSPDGEPVSPATVDVSADRGEINHRPMWHSVEAAILGGSFLLSYGYSGVFQTLLPLRAGLALGLAADRIALLMTVGYITNILLLVPAGWLSDRIGKARTLLGGLFLLLLGAVLFGAGDTIFLMALCSILLGASFCTWMMPAAMLGARASRQRRGKVLGLYRCVIDVGNIFGPLTLGVIAGYQGYRAAGAVFAGIAACVFLLFLTRISLVSKNSS